MTVPTTPINVPPPYILKNATGFSNINNIPVTVFTATYGTDITSIFLCNTINQPLQITCQVLGSDFQIVRETNFSMEAFQSREMLDGYYIFLRPTDQLILNSNWPEGGLDAHIISKAYVEIPGDTNGN